MFGVDGGGVPRVPIPNTTVKSFSADGTWTAGSWESRTTPSTMKPLSTDSGFFVGIERIDLDPNRRDRQAQPKDRLSQTLKDRPTQTLPVSGRAPKGTPVPSGLPPEYAPLLTLNHPPALASPKQSSTVPAPLLLSIVHPLIRISPTRHRPLLIL